MTEAASATPTEQDAARILAEVFGRSVASIKRFPTGLAHFVYDARIDDGRPIVIRLTRHRDAAEFAGALYCHERLKPIGTPLPEVLYEDVQGTHHRFPVMILERFPGTDLGDVYPALGDAEKMRISAWVVDLQHRTATLPHGRSYGYAPSYDDSSLLPTWKDVLLGSLDRTKRRIEFAGVVDGSAIASVQTQLDLFDAYLARIEPMPFLHDTTTKNVIIDNGEPSGIVDVNSIC